MIAGMKEGDIVSIYSHPQYQGQIGIICAIDYAKNPYEFYVQLNLDNLVHTFTYRQLSKYQAPQCAQEYLANSPVLGEYRSYNGCRHEYKQYIGIREQFEYCTKCDARK